MSSPKRTMTVIFREAVIITRVVIITLTGLYVLGKFLSFINLIR